MSKRLQVLLEPKEYKTFQQIAREMGLSLGEWVRQALRRVAGNSPLKSPQEKMEAVRRAMKHNSPSGDIDKILAEIEQGYLQNGFR